MDRCCSVIDAGARSRRSETPTITPPMMKLAASATLHAQAGLQACEPIGRDAVNVVVLAAAVTGGFDACIHSVGVFAGEVEQVDAGEDGEEAAEEGDGIDGVGGIEASKHDKGGCESAGCKGHIVQWVNTGTSHGQHLELADWAKR